MNGIRAAIFVIIILDNLRAGKKTAREKNIPRDNNRVRQSYVHNNRAEVARLLQ